LNPTRLEYLQITHDFSADPREFAFALLGTRHHQKLEAVAKKIEGMEAELALKGEVSGILDLLEPINGSDQYRLIDYKTYGSYAVAKLLNDKQAGEYDRHKLALQLNNYRLMAQGLGFNVVELKAQCTVRDGGTFTAKRNGIVQNIYLIAIDMLDNEDVTSYFSGKASALLKALETNTMPELCPYQERWANKRCLSFCNIVAFCPEGSSMKKHR